MALDLPIPGGDAGTWDEKLNAALTQLDTEKIGTATATSTFVAKAAAALNVDDFGAKGDGSTDDTAAISAARDAAIAQGGGVLSFRRGGTYRVSRILVSSGVQYVGNGATLVGTSATTEGIFESESWSNAALTVTDARVEGFHFDLNKTARRAVFLIRAQRCVVQNNRMTNFSLTADQAAVQLHFDTYDCRVENNDITLSVDSPFGTIASAVGVYCVGGSPDPQGGGQNATLTFGSVTTPSRRHQIVNNRIRNGTHAVVLFAASFCSVRGNETRDQTHRGIILSPLASDNLIAGNSVLDFGSTGIHMAWGCTRNSITGNLLWTSKSNIEGDGIKGYFGCSYNLVSGNSVWGCANAGIRFAVGSQHNTVSGNRIGGSHTGVKIESVLTTGGYYVPTSAPEAVGNAVIGNTADGTASPAGGAAFQFEAANAINLKRCTWASNFSFNYGTHFRIVEGSSGAVNTLDAHANVATGAGTFWSLARGVNHFRQVVGNSGLADKFASTELGFYGVAPVTRQTLAAAPTTDQIRTVLINLGLVQ